MGISSLTNTVLASADISALTEAVTDSSTTVVTGTFDKFMNADFFNLLCNNFANSVALGFALTTILILLTFGAFKAFSFVRID